MRPERDKHSEAGPQIAETILKTIYYAGAVVAILCGTVLLVVQIVGGLDYTRGASPVEVAYMVTAMITVAVLPLFIHAAWALSKTISVVLFLAFASFLAYSLPANMGRVGEAKEVKALAADDAAQMRADLASIERTLRIARPQMEAECLSAPDPLPLDKNRWPECRRKRGTVNALDNDRARIASELRKMGSARVGDLGSDNLAWLLGPLLGVGASSIRKGSAIGFAVGLEFIIFALFALAAVAIRKGLAERSQQAVALAPVATEAESELRQPRHAPPITTPPDEGGGGGGRRSHTRDEALADLRLLLQAGHTPPSQQWLVDRWGISKGACSKWLAIWEATGDIEWRRVTDGRCKAVVAE